MMRGMPSNNNSQPMFFYTYVLQSGKDNECYVGYTQNLRKRLEEYRRSRSFATQYRLPLDLIYYEACLDMADAEQREKYLKTTVGRRCLAKRLRCFNHDTVWLQAN